MKILFCLGSMTKGGAERVIANLANCFIKKYDIAIVVTPPDKPMYEIDSKVKYYTLDNNKEKKNFIFRNIERITRLRKILKEFNPDIIVSLLPEPTFRLMIAKTFLNKKVIISVRNDPNIEYNTIFKKFLVKLLYTKANGFIFQTEDAKKWFSKRIQDKSIIIPNPINESFICKPFEGEREKVVVNVGRLNKQKNQKLLINAFYEFQKIEKDYELRIYGNGPLKNELETLISKLGISNKVKLMGEVDNLKDEIYKSGIFVLTSDYEGMPNALMEAMAIGLPCISSNCPIGGPKFLIQNGKNGFLFDVNNKEQLLSLLLKLSKEKDTCKNISKNANEICNLLNPGIINDKWEKYILKILYSKEEI